MSEQICLIESEVCAVCVAMPGKIISIDKTVATVDFSGNTVKAEMGLVDAKVGDCVLVHAGCILQVLSKTESDELFDIFKDLDEVIKEND